MIDKGGLTLEQNTTQSTHNLSFLCRSTHLVQLRREMLEQIVTPQLTLCIRSIGTGRTDVTLLLLLGMLRVL